VINSIGPITAEKVVEGLAENSDLIDNLLKHITIGTGVKKIISGKFSGMSFVFTGTMQLMGRKEAQALVESMGGECPSSVSKELTYLVCGEDERESTKAKKANSLNDKGANIKIIEEKEFLELVK
jgi:DNA ligase (NAD+)